MFALPEYAKVKDNYCLCYFGASDEYLTQFKLLRDVIQQRFEGLCLYFGCKDDKTHLLGDQPDVMKASELKMKKRQFAQIKYIEFNGETHPIEDLLVQSQITNFAVTVPEIEHSSKMVITTRGSYPTVPLTRNQIDMLRKIGQRAGYDVEIDTNWQDAGWVAGVECVALYEAAGAGLKTSLVATGIGRRLYQRMFPQGEIINP